MRGAQARGAALPHRRRTACSGRRRGRRAVTRQRPTLPRARRSRTAGSPPSRARRRTAAYRTARGRARGRERRSPRSGPRRPARKERRAGPAARPQRQPEPRVERGQDEDERVRPDECDRQRDDAEPDESDRVARQPLLGRRWPDGHGELPSRDEPADEEGDREYGEPCERRVGHELRGGWKRKVGAGRQDPRQRRDAEQQSRVQPQQEARAEPAKGRPVRKAATAIAREEVEHAQRERGDRRDQGQPHGPPARGPVAEEERVGGPERRSHARVDRSDQRLGRPSHLAQPLNGELARRISDGNVRLTWVVSGDRHRRDPLVEEDALLSGGERECEVDELCRHRREERRPPGLLLDSGRRRADERSGGRGGAAACEREPRAAGAADPVEDDDDLGVLGERGLLDEAAGALAAVGARVRGDEHQGPLRQRGGSVLLRREAAGELDQRGGAGGVVAEGLVASAVVATGDDDGRLLGATRDDRGDVP